MSTTRWPLRVGCTWWRQVSEERHERERGLGPAIGHPLAAVLHHQGPAGEGGRQGHDERSDHRAVLLRVLVRDKELPRGVDQHGVELGCQLATVGEAEIAAEPFQHRVNGLRPPALVDPHPAEGNLPGVADPGVEQCSLGLPVPRRPADLAQLARLRVGHGEAKRPDPPHLDRQVAGRRGAPGAE